MTSIPGSGIKTKILDFETLFRFGQIKILRLRTVFFLIAETDGLCLCRLLKIGHE